jgi:hypothetical protein
MSLDRVKEFQSSTFSIPRYTDSQLVEKVTALAQEWDLKIDKATFVFTFAPNQNAEFAGNNLNDAKLQEVLDMSTVSTWQIIFELGGWFRLNFRRDWDGQARVVKGNRDTVTIEPFNQQNANHTPINFARAIAITRKHFGATDTKPFMDFLEEGPRQLYEAREQDLQKLERMQEDFFRSMTQFTAEQQKKQQEFTRDLESQYVARQKSLEEQHAERLKQLEAKEADLKKIRDELDERENRQARRDIYKELKKKLDERNKSFELTTGTKRRRWITFGLTVSLLGVLGWGFYYCFDKNVVHGGESINWIAVSSQIGFAVAFLGTFTFLIRWTNQWSQKHANEEFKLKRLDLDIDRANWLVELAMEWKNITKSEISADLIDKLSRSLFVADDGKEIDIHPAETLLSALFGRAGSVNFEIPGSKLVVQRSESADGKAKDEKGEKAKN